MTIILFIIILAVLIFVHELGHFLAAKSIGVRVDEFGLGFPPRLMTYKKGETVYSLNLIPFGGFVKIFGENPGAENDLPANRSKSLNHRSKLAQAWVLVAGVLFNWILAWFIFWVALTSGLPMSVDNVKFGANLVDIKTVITQVQAEGEADRVGLLVGDKIEYLASSKKLAKEPTVEEFQTFIKSNQGLITIGFDREGKQSQVSLEAKYDQATEAKIIGVGLDQVGTLKLSWLKAIPASFLFTVDITVGMFSALKDLALTLLSGDKVAGAIVGPVGIAGLVGDASALGFMYVLTFMAIISINLAIVNLLPFPALDGGRLMFLLIEAISRKKINQTVMNTLNLVGFMILLLLMVVISAFDIWRLF